MNKIKNISLLVLTLLLSVSLMNCNGDDDADTGPTPGENEIFMINTTFDPPNLTISQGTTITWINQDNIAHTTTSNDGLWDSGTMNNGDTFSYTFDNTGTFDYRCAIHPNVMTGQIVVQ